MSTKILVADGHRIVRDGLLRILADSPDLEVVGEAADGREALELIRSRRPDVALIDALLPTLGAYEVVFQARRDSPGTQCIVLADHATPVQVKRALRAGALAFVPKSVGAKDLLEAVGRVRIGRAYLPACVSDQVVACVQGEAGPREAGLTGRQREVLKLVAEGLSAKEIAAALGVSEGTAKTHRATLMRKLGVRKASGLVRIAIREGIVPA